MKKNLLPILATTAVLTLSACAKSTKDIQPEYVSPLQYNSFSCSQIEQEMMRLSRKVSDLGGQVDDEHSNDQVKMGVGLVLFWPTLFFLDGDTASAKEYGRIRGEFDALEQTAIQKNCKVDVVIPKPEKKAIKKKTSDYPGSR